ncbi:flagellar hook-associated protein FlgK [Tissierella creatinophila]|uniref:Flagellar hook-associated protein 1 n=1 Tax=Tissierella creatinophila DSM 6911 TaxID=1123403 RepID=A0A1U7M2U4_TISCR|nr:flagellar hook-associated protein FlgK [Tissierella creatinophila]OLS01539.1 flagellar hook-associated protein 1 [Tissierella creatinophila DSM 6911]
MSGIFSSMNTATKGLMAQQTALHTTGHNIANINTEGFSRQRVDMKADRAYNYGGIGQLGTGVRMESIVRMVDNHVSKQIRAENSTLSRFAEKSEVINQLEVIFNEPSDTGLNFNIGEMFDAFQELSKNPENLNSKTLVVEKLKTLTDTLNHMAGQIESLESETHASIDKNILDFNSKVDGLNTLNKQIFNVSIKGQIPNDLLDQRDLMLKDLTAIADVSIDFDKYGRVGIEMGGNKILTQEGEQNELKYDKYDKDNPNKTREVKLVNSKDNSEATITVTNGSLLGNMDALRDIDNSKKNLDKMASTMAQAINRVHGQLEVKDQNGNLVEAGFIFTVKEGKNPEDAAMNIEINKALVSDNSLLQSGKNGNEGDGSLALELAGLRNKKLGEDGKEDQSGNTIGGSYRDIVIKIGISKQHSDNMVENQEALTQQLENRRESVSGVSINDEITNVIKFQKAYEANAKVLSALTEMLDVLINRTGV